jgi:hypothetical protein
MHESSRQLPADFVLFEGGPLSQFWQRWQPARPLVESLARRVVMISTFTWLPLLVLALVEGLASRENFEAAVRTLGEFVHLWPDAVRGLMTSRFPIEEAPNLLSGRASAIKEMVAVGGRP